MVIAMKGLMQLKKPVDEASYIVFTDGSKYYAKNGLTGLIEYSDTDASNVIQYAIDKLRGVGGVVMLKKGLYTVYKAIRLYSNITLAGEGFSTIIRRGNVFESTLTQPASSGQNTIVVNDASGFRAGQQVFIGTKSSSSSHWEVNRIASVEGNRITLVQPLQNDYSAGESVYTAYHVIEAFSEENIMIRDLSIDGNKANNYYYTIYDTATTAKAYDDYLGIRPSAFLVQNGIHLSGCRGCLVSGVKVFDNVGWGGIAVISSSNVTVKNCITEYGYRHGILVAFNSENVVVSNCISRSNGKPDETFPRHNIIFEYVRRCVLADSIAVNAPGNNFYAYDAQDILLIGNIFAYAGLNIYLASSGYADHRITIIGNILIGQANQMFNILLYDYVSNVLIEGNSMYHTYELGIHVSVHANTEKAWIIGNRMVGGRIGVYTYTTKGWVYVANNIFDSLRGNDTNPSYAISALKVNNIIAKNNIVYGNNTTHYAVRIGTDASNVTVEDNVFTELKVKPLLIEGGTNIVIRRNKGYLTENSGVATIPAGSTRVTVSHGLASTPTKFQITPLGQPAGKLWVENITSTSFDIVTDTAPASNLNVSWYAEV